MNYELRMMGTGQWFFFIILNSYFLILTSFIPFVSVYAQDQGEIRAVIRGPKEVAIGKTIVLDASLSTADPKTVSYLWTRAGEIVSRSDEAILTLDRPGTFAITLTVRDRLGGKTRSAEVSEEITVYIRKLVLIAGPAITQEKIELHRESGRAAGVFVDMLHAEESAIPLGAEDAMTKLVAENTERFPGAEAIILWSEGASAMNALTRALRKHEDRLPLVAGQTIVLITDGGIQTLARVARAPFSVLHPRRIVITRKEAINPLIEKANMEDFLAEIEKRDIDFSIVDTAALAVRPWNLLTTLTNYMITHGVSSDMIILLLMLPVILTIIAFLKQIIGVTTFGLYTPAVVTLSFVALGWKIGLALLCIILIAGYVTRALVSRYRLLYIPKIAVILTVISIVLLIVLAAAAAFGIILAADTIFILLIMTTLSEEFMSTKAEMGLRSALAAIGETVLVAFLCFLIVQWAFLKALILAYPELILFTIIANVLLGKWTGLRVSEVIRFREIFKYMEE